MVKKFHNKYKFGFAECLSVKLAQMDIEEFMDLLFSTIATNLDLLLLFELDQILLTYELRNLYVALDNTRTMDTQTDHRVYENYIPPSEWIQHTWNIWDYHRETILLANMRRKQTRSAQTKLTYGKRNAKNQMYDTRSHKSTQNWEEKPSW